MRFLKPVLVVAATVSIVAAGAATSFAMSGPTLASATSSSTAQLNSASSANPTQPGLNAPSSLAGKSAGSTASSSSLGLQGRANVPQLSSHSSGAQITKAAAISVALNSSAGATVVSAERSTEPAGVVWKIQLSSNGAELQYTVSATTGALIATSSSSDDSAGRNSDAGH